MLGQAQHRAGFIGREAAHGVCGKAHGVGLQRQVAPGAARIKAVLGGCLLVRQQHDQRAGIQAPAAVEFIGQLRESLPVGIAAQGVGKVPGLLVAGRRSPAGGFCQLLHLGGAQRLSHKGAGRHALQKLGLDGGGACTCGAHRDIRKMKQARSQKERA